MLSIPYTHQLSVQQAQENERRRRAAQQQLGSFAPTPQEQQAAPQQGITPQQGLDLYNMYDRVSNGGNAFGGGAIGGGATAIASFGKFYDWGFDSNSSSGGFMRDGMHTFEDVGRPIKNTAKDALMTDKWWKPFKESDQVKSITGPIDDGYHKIAGGLGDGFSWFKNLF